MNKFIVTGGEGFIGSKIVAKAGAISFDIKSQKDILDTVLLEEHTKGVEGLFHCAAKISVPESVTNPREYYRTNVEGTKSVIDASNENNLKIVFSSSAAVYGESSLIVSEDAVLNPKSPYAENKRDGEDLLRQTGNPHVALRYFNVFGPGQSAQYAGVITAFIFSALNGTDLIIYGDGKQVRDFIYVDDIVNANIAAMNLTNTSFEVFNIASGIETTINDLAEVIIRLTNSSSKIRYLPAREGDIVYSQANISKAKNILGWVSETSLEEGLKKTIKYIDSIK